MINGSFMMWQKLTEINLRKSLLAPNLIIIGLLFFSPFCNLISAEYTTRLFFIVSLSIVLHKLIFIKKYYFKAEFILFFSVIFLCLVKIYQFSILLPVSGLILGSFLSDKKIKIEPLSPFFFLRNNFFY